MRVKCTLDEAMTMSDSFRPDRSFPVALQRSHQNLSVRNCFLLAPDACKRGGCRGMIDTVGQDGGYLWLKMGVNPLIQHAALFQILTCFSSKLIQVTTEPLIVRLPAIMLPLLRPWTSK